MPSVAPLTSWARSVVEAQSVPHLPGPHEGVGLDDAPPRRKDEREREVCGRRVEDARRVRDGDAVGGAGRDVDVVVADAVVRDEPQVRGSSSSVRASITSPTTASASTSGRGPVSAPS